MVRDLAVLVLKRAALTLLGVAVKLNGRRRGGPREVDLPAAELPRTGGPRTPEASSMVAETRAVEFDTVDVDDVLPGSVADRIAKARGGW